MKTEKEIKEELEFRKETMKAQLELDPTIDVCYSRYFIKALEWGLE